MGQQQSKGELLYQQVNYGNIDGIKALHSEGADLEWMDREGKTPLIVACMNPQLHNVANTLIELGANVNAYRPGRHAGTPLHHAAKRGLEQTVKLLLSHGANPLVINDDCQTPLDVARAKGYSNVVRAIESHICLFSGWLLELYGPGFLELFAPQLLSRKVWVVVLPCGSRNLRKPFKLELAVYASAQDAQPRMTVALWKANMEEPKFNQPDPAVIITDSSTIPRRWRRKRGIVSSREGRCRPRGARQTRIKLAAANENDKQQLQAFCNACKGIPQVVHTTFPFNAEVPVVPSLPATAPPAHPEDVELAMAINASLQSAAQEIQPHVETYQGSGAAASTSSSSSLTGISDSHPGDSTPQMGGSSKCQVEEETNSSSSSVQLIHTPGGENPSVVQANANPVSVSSPSAPPVSAAPIDDGPIFYPAIDTSPVDLSSPTVETLPTGVGGGKEDGTASSSCVVCLDAPAEGVCVPCGHMAGCMSCLNEIKAKKWGCPVCRAKIDQVIRVYAV